MAGLTEKKEKAKKKNQIKKNQIKKKRKRTEKILIIMNMEYVPMSCTC